MGVRFFCHKSFDLQQESLTEFGGLEMTGKRKCRIVCANLLMLSFLILTNLNRSLNQTVLLGAPPVRDLIEPSP